MSEHLPPMPAATVALAREEIAAWRDEHGALPDVYAAAERALSEFDQGTRP